MCSQFYRGRIIYILYLNIVSGLLYLFNSPFSFQYITYNYLLFSFRTILIFRHRASCILGQAFHCSPESAFYVFNQQIYLII